MSAPKRIQLSRKKGFKLPDGAINCARPGKFGNPFKVGGYFKIGDIDPRARFQMSWMQSYEPDPRFTLIETNEHAVAMFEQLLARGHFKADLSKLRGHDLACYCKPEQACHADVLLREANR